ncbi:very short patch repair endonuclease [Rathayibacter caricis DSM 15933]|uniref:Very short patch repair endonuclease n=1 Tax=Rathayibacter caricis DSM 15933 TaxID=1328867 RepID=A0A2T4UUK6_9MICO|nr:very short patch repair endonuclease [Rathayibacter caricis]PTL73228.1 very short patch repair endonuclease [Rathayibacter caricis DSM 15933]
MTNSWASSAGARARMQANRGRDTKPELMLRSELHRRGLRYRVNLRPERDLRRTADLLFSRARVAVFVDGCFWHGCPQHFSQPKTNPDFWLKKIERNRNRDRDTSALLETRGWIVIRFWEHEIMEGAADSVEKAVREASQLGKKVREK